LLQATVVANNTRVPIERTEPELGGRPVGMDR
jgi:hypothetical protein